MQLNSSTDDIQIIEMINSDAYREDALKYLFHNQGWRNKAIEYVKKNGGDTQDGEDVAQEAIVIFDSSIRRGKFKGDGTLESYYSGITRFCWLKTVKKKKQNQAPEDSVEEEKLNVESIYISNEKKEFLKKALIQSKIGKRCIKIFRLYGLGYSHKEIAEKIPTLSNADMAKKANFRCRERFRKFLDDNPEWKKHIV